MRILEDGGSGAEKYVLYSSSFLHLSLISRLLEQTS